MAMLEVKDLRTSFFTPAGEVKAVNGISFNLDSGKVLGYAGVLVMADEGYITNVAVFPEYRRHGIGAAIIEVFMNFARGNDLAFLTLEVRPSNTAAIALYEGFGFEEVGRRKNYYDLPKEDALILTRYFKEEARV